jgi:type VI secretion system secreted protein Hcp
MAEGFFVTIVGRKQGKFKPEGVGAAGKIKGLAFHYEVASPRDSASGQASGKRQHSPVSFVKAWGAASPQLFQAAVTNEVLDSVLFEFVETTPDGKEAVFQTVKLANAFVASIKLDAKAAPGGHELQDVEEVSIVFQSIEMENLTGKTAAADNWQGGAAAGGAAAGAAAGGGAGAAGGAPAAGGAAAGGAAAGAAAGGGAGAAGGGAPAEADKPVAPRVLRDRTPGA